MNIVMGFHLGESSDGISALFLPHLRLHVRRRCNRAAKSRGRITAPVVAINIYNPVNRARADSLVTL